MEMYKGAMIGNTWLYSLCGFGAWLRARTYGHSDSVVGLVQTRKWFPWSWNRPLELYSAQWIWAAKGKERGVLCDDSWEEEICSWMCLESHLFVSCGDVDKMVLKKSLKTKQMEINNNCVIDGHKHIHRAEKRWNSACSPESYVCHTVDMIWKAQYGSHIETRCNGLSYAIGGFNIFTRTLIRKLVRW